MKLSTKQLKQEFKFIQEDCIYFTTHEQLDKFVNKLLQQDPNFLTKEKNKYTVALLKSFDRAFWLRFMTSNYINSFIDITISRIKRNMKTNYQHVNHYKKWINNK